MITTKKVFNPDSPDIDAEVYGDIDRPFGHRDLFKGGPMWLTARNCFNDADKSIKPDRNYFFWSQHLVDGLKSKFEKMGLEVLDIKVSDGIIVDDDDYYIEEVDI